MTKLAVLFAAALASPAPAALLFSQGPPNLNSFDIANYRLADEFTLAMNSILSGIDFWYDAQAQGDLTLVTWAIYNSAGGALGTLAASGTATAVTSVNAGAFQASLAITGVNLLAGTYWLELHAGSSLTDTNNSLAVYWEATADNRTLEALYHATGLPSIAVNTSGYNQYSFDIQGAAVPAVPEASSTALMALGGGMLAARRRSRTVLS